NDAANQAITENLGNLGDLNNGAGGSHDTPTPRKTHLDTSRHTTDIPDRSTNYIDNDSRNHNTTHPDGTVTTHDQGDGARENNPDGSLTSHADAGKLTTTIPDGTT
ncbi:hypothetical protein PUR33_00515, partial [Streptomyces sp. BE282]|uniref:hypothetical protein n=1 Tax=Streptomyces sp. BE282 TaxID=3002527 RepID=UPI002E7AA876